VELKDWRKIAGEFSKQGFGSIICFSLKLEGGFAILFEGIGDP
jgi:hypothetical protein